MNETAAPKLRSSTERQPIVIEKLIISHANVHGVRIPHGYKGESDRLVHTVRAGIEGDIKTEIEWRPWMRMYRVSRFRRVTSSSAGPGGREVVRFEPMGKPFVMPETWAVAVPAEE